MNQAATDAKQRPGFQARKSGKKSAADGLAAAWIIRRSMLNVGALAREYFRSWAFPVAAGVSPAISSLACQAVLSSRTFSEG